MSLLCQILLRLKNYQQLTLILLLASPEQSLDWEILWGKLEQFWLKATNSIFPQREVVWFSEVFSIWSSSIKLLKVINIHLFSSQNLVSRASIIFRFIVFTFQGWLIITIWFRLLEQLMSLRKFSGVCLWNLILTHTLAAGILQYLLQIPCFANIATRTVKRANRRKDVSAAKEKLPKYWNIRKTPFLPHIFKAAVSYFWP